MTTGSSLSPRTFMLVDDDPDGRFFAERSLKLNFPDCSLSVCVSVDEAIRRLETVRPDAIVTDHQLGRHSGCDFIAHVRQRGMTCPVVMVTCSDDPGVAKAAMHAGATKVFRAGDDEFAEFLKEQLEPPAKE
jgi:CheY-like chemotaxis protein